MPSIIDKMIYDSCKCLKCGRSMQECLSDKNCTLKCYCGWMYRIDSKCNNPIHNKLPNKYKSKTIKKQTEQDKVKLEGRY